MIKKALVVWTVLFVITVGIFGTIYVVAQQNFRQNANDPQIEMVEDAVRRLSDNVSPQAVVGSSEAFDIRTRITPFLIIYNQNGQGVAGNAKLNNKLPVLPEGVFEFAAENGTNKITWQPAPGFRYAAVIKPYYASRQSGYVLAARSLREVEKREGTASLIIFAGWLGTLLVSCILSSPLSKK